MDGQMNVAYLLHWSQQFLCNVIIPLGPWTPNFINPYQGGGRDPPFCSCMKMAWCGCNLSPGWCSTLLDVLTSPATPPALALTTLMWKASLLVFSQAQINYCHWLLSFITSLEVLLSCYSTSLISITNEDVKLVLFIIYSLRDLDNLITTSLLVIEWYLFYILCLVLSLKGGQIMYNTLVCRWTDTQQSGHCDVLLLAKWIVAFTVCFPTRLGKS